MQAGIALANATRGFDKLYTYKIPESLNDQVYLGSLVKVPFGYRNSTVNGVVIEISEDRLQDSKFKVKDISSVIDTIPVSEVQLELIHWMKKRYICTYFEAARCMSPTYAIESSKTVRIASLQKEASEIVNDIETMKLNKIQHVTVLELLLEYSELPVPEIISRANVSISVINTLVKKEYIKLHSEKVTTNFKIQKGMKGQAIIPHSPTLEQRKVLDVISSSLKSNEFHEYLLHGITGSGKTEVYLQLIQEILALGKSAIVLVPEISLTPLMIGRFEARFPGSTAVLHSRMTASEKRNSWNRISKGEAKVVVGARSAIFAPVQNLGIVVVDEEHETTYKSEVTPKYNAIEVARFLCERQAAVLLLGSATPSVDTYYKSLNSSSKLLKMNQRTNLTGLPEVEIVDMRKELDEGNRSIFSRFLKSKMNDNIKNDLQTMLFLNRRGFSSFVICRDCGYVVKCRDCSVSMTYHKKTNKLTCHYCGRLEKNPEICPVCKSKKIRFFGTGTQKIEEELKKEFENVTYIRMDLDTTTGKGSHEEILSRFEHENIQVMIGTQMITKGHDFEKVTLVGVLAADSSLYSPDFRASERTFQQITQVSGRAGRGKHSGQVVIQTYNCDHPTIIAAARQNYEEFYNSEIIMRKTLNYPPYFNIGCLIVHGVNETDTKAASVEVANELESLIEKTRIENIELIGPAPSPSSRLRGRNRIRIILKHPEIDVLIDLLSAVSDSFYTKKHREIDLSVDINPYNMV